jgi:phosphoserine phosphatase
VGKTQTLLIQVNGPDEPGITSALMKALDDLDAVVHDVEQVVVRRLLALSAVVELPTEADLAQIEALAHGRAIRVSIEPVDETPSARVLGLIVTVLAEALSPSNIGAVANGVARCGGNIDRIVRLSRYPVYSYELAVSGAPEADLRASLMQIASEQSIDIAIQPDGIGRRSQRLVMLDVDSTLIQDEVIDLLAAEAGHVDQVRDITNRAMTGEVDFEDALRQRVKLLAGLDEAALERAADRVQLTPGARTFVRTLQRLGFRVAIVSGGFTYFTDRLAQELDLDHAHANELEMVDGRLTGELVGRVVDRRRKADLLTEVAAKEGIPLDQTVAVGDGANDLDMLGAAGLGIAFNAKPIVQERADTSISVPFLDAVLFILGVRRHEVDAADTAGPLD